MFSANRQVDIVVYCGGKCGSTTLETTFNKNGFHAIRAHGIHEWNLRFPRGPDIISIINNSKKVYIIDAYRTPIERKISSFFHNITQHVPFYEYISIPNLIEIFNNHFLSHLEEYHPIDEVMQVFDVPPFTEFDFTRGYVMKEHNNMVFIKLLFRDIASWETNLSSIFGRNITLQPDNITSSMNIYTAFKAAYRVPATYLTQLQNDRHFHIFNTPEEQKEYIAKWALKVDTAQGM
jgi:hypothetical protein